MQLKIKMVGEMGVNECRLLLLFVIFNRGYGKVRMQDIGDLRLFYVL